MHLGRIVNGNRLLFNCNCLYLRMNFAVYGNCDNVGNYGSPGNIGRISLPYGDGRCSGKIS